MSARSTMSIHHRQARAAWMFLAPGLLLLTIFTAWPLLRTVYLSLTDYNLLTPPEWVGLDNYRELLADPQVMNAFGNTLLYAVVVTPVTIGLAMLFALALNERFFARTLVRTAVFVPFVVSLAVISIAFRFLLDPNYGLVTHWLSAIGLAPQQGALAQPHTAMAAVMLVGVWKNVGFYMVMFLAGLQSIPRELYEAAQLDGTSRLQRFRAVTLPLLSNQTMLVSILAATASFQVFDQIKVMTNGGPAMSTETLVVLVNRVGINNLEFGYGSAVSVILLVLILILSLAQYLYFGRRQVRY
ncbi:carbohydrate ABC transporter permease [Occultella gossypii]|uniref:Sugar ABC transporter permease n=1 Tax=Occultella gossypii TaxID=2800820 RepID=A0ABS7S862_9MICO|nr:sugar ABC transporter permease [Occultella gossypii]MBZ2195461.1 sugar ABC transporter permease [Occultella gossypii]